ncbi:MAG: hypothetical protein ACI9NC_004460 [Verrucomicrobiales bacterium]|jgi:hypothetical protein
MPSESQGKRLGIHQVEGFAWTGVGDDRANLVSWLSDGTYPDAAFDHLLMRGGGMVCPAETIALGDAIRFQEPNLTPPAAARIEGAPTLFSLLSQLLHPNLTRN